MDVVGIRSGVGRHHVGAVRDGEQAGDGPEEWKVKKYTEEAIRKAWDRASACGAYSPRVDQVLVELTIPRLKPDRPVMYDRKATYGQPTENNLDFADYLVSRVVADSRIYNIRPLFTEEEVMEVFGFGNAFELPYVAPRAMQNHLHALCYEEDDS